MFFSSRILYASSFFYIIECVASLPQFHVKILHGIFRLTTGDEPYYPVNDEKNTALYARYRELAQAQQKVIFGGRLGQYKYYDMDKVIEAALDMLAVENK